MWHEWQPDSIPERLLAAIGHSVAADVFRQAVLYDVCDGRGLADCADLCCCWCSAAAAHIVAPELPS